MSLVAAAVCPHPPLMLPEVAAGAARETDGLRRAALAAVAELVAVEPDLVVVVGDAPETTTYASGDSASFDRYGVALRVPLGPAVCAGQPVLPLSVGVGAWLLRQTGWTGERQGFGVGADTAPCDAAQAGEQLADLEPRVALLVMGDGSARRSVKAPGYLDARAAPFDAEVTAALADGDPGRLLALDPALARDLLAAGRASWQVLAGAALAGPVRSWRGHIGYDEAPYGVGYIVAGWSPAVLPAPAVSAVPVAPGLPVAASTSGVPYASAAPGVPAASPAGEVR